MAEKKQGGISQLRLLSIMLQKVGIMEPEPRGNQNGNVNVNEHFVIEI